MPSILIVDDEPGITDAFIRVFRNDYRVTSSNDGGEAIELIKQAKPDLIVLDWRLKGEVEGKDILVYAKKEFPQIPVYVVTASVQSVKEIKSLGADECLLKPCADLKERINAVLPP